MNPARRSTYLRTQLVANFVINLVINGLIAFFSYRTRGTIQMLEVAVDMQITLAIIGFLVAWLAILTARKNSSPDQPGEVRMPGIRLPKSAALRALVIMLLLMVVFGGLLTGGLFLSSPDGITSWGYIILKALYTASAALLTAWLAILSVYQEAAQKG